MKSNALVPKLGKKRDNRDRREDEGGEGAIYGILISHVVSWTLHILTEAAFLTSSSTIRGIAVSFA
jgi:hypothetical protein